MRTRWILEAFGEQERSHSGEQIPVSLPQFGRKKWPAREARRGHGRRACLRRNIDFSPVFGADYDALTDGLFGMGSLQASTV